MVAGVQNVLPTDRGPGVALTCPISELALKLILPIRHFALQAVDSLSGISKFFHQVGFLAFSFIGCNVHRAALFSHRVKLIFQLGAAGLTPRRR